ncbi:MAG: cupin domain-containing protein [candidate division NC10 bacterium]|nr:cupin domain-containing protein [candidate division NC10 bacterium]
MGKEQPEMKAGVIRLQDLPMRSLVEGAASRLLFGERIMLSFIEIAPHTHFPRHRHAEEQFMVVLEGEIDEIVEDRIVRLGKGDVCYLPSNVEHGGYTHESPCRAIDIFSPPRADYRAMGGKGGK